jgi:plastocyanin
MRGRARLLFSALGAAALALPVVTASSAGATAAPSAVTVNISGADHFIEPGFFTNDFRFPSVITVKRGGTITWVNNTAESHTMALVPLAAVPKTTAQVDNCTVCNTVNTAFGLNGPGQPAGAQIDNGVVGAVPGDAPDTGAIASAKGPLPPQAAFPILIVKFNDPTRGAAVGDATLVDTAGPNGNSFPIQRTVLVTAGPGRYHYICTLHPWMQGSIEVVG